MRLVASLAVAVLFVGLVAPVGGAQEANGAPGLEVVRYGGQNRFDTAALIATDDRISAGRFETGTVLVATGDTFPDSLAGGYLAGALRAPVLLTGTEQVAPELRAALDRLQPDTIVLLGGTAALSPAVEEELRRDHDVVRIGGADRFATAAEVASYRSGAAEEHRTALLASGGDFPDALAAGAVATAEGVPLLLTGADRLAEPTASALQRLDVEEVVIAGGTAAVSQDVEDRLREQGYRVRRVAGPNRFATARAIADYAEERFGWSGGELNLVNGGNFPDAVAMAARAGLGSRGPSPIALALPDVLPAETADWLADAGTCDFALLLLAGGPAALSPTVEASAIERLDQSACPPDETVPEVAFTAPAQDAEVATEAGVLRLEGTAADTGSGVRAVELTVGGDRVGSTPVSRGAGSRDWAVDVVPPSAGSYVFTATAIDGEGNLASTSLSLTVRQAGSEDVVTAPDVVVAGTADLAVTVVGDDGAVRIDGPGAADMEAGDVLVSASTPAAPEGLLRRVVLVREQGGEVELTTTPARITDAVLQGELRVSQELRPEDVVAEEGAAEGAGLGVDPVAALAVPSPELTLWSPATDGGGALAVQEPIASLGIRRPFDFDLQLAAIRDKTVPLQPEVSGQVRLRGHDEVRVNLELEIDIDASFGWSGVSAEVSRFLVATTVDEEFHAKFSAQGSAAAVFWEKPIAKHVFTPYTFFIGPVPVVVVPELRASLLIKGAVAPQFSSEVTATHGYRIGADLQDGQWRPINQRTSSFASQPFGFSETQFDARAVLQAETALKVYGVAGPALRGELFLRGRYGTQEPNWALSAGLVGSVLVTARLPLVDRAIAEFSTEIFSHEEVLRADEDQAPGALAVSIEDPDAGTTLPCCDALLRAVVSNAAGPPTIAWESSQDGLLGEGAELRVSLSEGQHDLTASVQDTSGATANRTVNVTVGGAAEGFAVTAVVPNDATGALALGGHMATDPGLVAGAGFVTAPPAGASHGLTVRAPGFPAPADPALLTTGRADLADEPNLEEDIGVSAGGDSVRGDTDLDVTVLQLDLDVPAYANCLRFDFRFASEEFPEFVGHEFNDAFVAELDATTWTTSGSVIDAPGNFAFDPTGAPISVNSVNPTDVSPISALGTTYDAATLLLQAATPVTPGAHRLYLSLFDQGDDVYDSAALIDSLQAIQVSDAALCMSGASPAIGQLNLEAPPGNSPS